MSDTFPSVDVGEKSGNYSNSIKPIEALLSQLDTSNVPDVPWIERKEWDALFSNYLRCCVVLSQKPIGKGAFGQVSKFQGVRIGRVMYTVDKDGRILIKEGKCTYSADQNLTKDEDNCAAYFPGIVALRVLQSFSYGDVAPTILSGWTLTRTSMHETRSSFGYAISNAGIPLSKLPLEKLLSFARNIIGYAMWSMVYLAKFDMAHYDSSLNNCTFVPQEETDLTCKVWYELSNKQCDEYEFTLPGHFYWIDFDRVRRCSSESYPYVWSQYLPTAENRKAFFQFKKDDSGKRVAFGSFDKHGYQNHFMPVASSKEDFPYPAAVSLFFFLGSFLFFAKHPDEPIPKHLKKDLQDLEDIIFKLQQTMFDIKIHTFDDFVEFVQSATRKMFKQQVFRNETPSNVLCIPNKLDANIVDDINLYRDELTKTLHIVQQ